jgi:hypothetical protein
VKFKDDMGNRHHIWIRPRTARDKGLYRRVTTYRLSTDLLLKWRQAHRGESRAADPTPIRKQPAPQPQPLPPAPAAPLPAKRPAAHRSTQRESSSPRKLTPREGPKLINEIQRLKRGCNGHVGVDRLFVEYEKHDPRYREPMSQEKAIEAACMNLGIPYEAAVEHLKLCRPAAPNEDEVD